MRLACCVFALVTVTCVPLPGVAQSSQKQGKQAEKNRDEDVLDLTDDITPPRLIHLVNPEYSPGSRGVRLRGSVLVEVVVTSHGAPRDPHVIRGLDKDVDADVLQAVRQWLFDPARKQRKPVAVKITVEIEFHPM